MLRLNRGVGMGQPNDEEDVARLADALEEIGEFERPGFAGGGPLTTLSEAMVDGLKRVQERTGIEIDGYAEPNGPTQAAINNIRLAKPRGAWLFADPTVRVTRPVGDGFANDFADVKRVRRALGAVGYLPEHPSDEPSGFFDRDVEQALTKYQTDRKLRANARVHPDDETEAALLGDVARLTKDHGDEFTAYFERAAAAGDSRTIAAKARRAASEEQHWSLLPLAEADMNDLGTSLGTSSPARRKEQTTNIVGGPIDARRSTSTEDDRADADERTNRGGYADDTRPLIPAKDEPDIERGKGNDDAEDKEAERRANGLIARHRGALKDELTRSSPYRPDFQPLIDDIVAIASRLRNASPAERERALVDIYRRIDREAGPESETASRLRNGARRAISDSDKNGLDAENLFYYGALGKTPIGEAYAEARRSAEPKIVSPPDGLKPSVGPESGFTLANPNDSTSRLPIPVNRSAAVRDLLSRFYRLGARGEDGKPSLSDDDYKKFLDAAQEHVSERHFPIFELTARAVREGLIAWQVAAERLTKYFAPESTGNVIADTLLDLAPLVGQVKAAGEIYELLEKARDAAALGDKGTARRFAEQAALAAAGLVPFGGFGAIAKAGAKNFAKEIEHYHHVFPRYLGRGWREGVYLPSSHHIDLHSQLRQFFSNRYPDLNPSWMRPGILIQHGTSRARRVNAVHEFYQQLSDPRFKAAVEKFDQIFPELRKWADSSRTRARISR